MEERRWHYVEKEGNPTKEGAYYVTLIYPEVKKVGEGCERDDFEKTGRMFAEVTIRSLCDASKFPSWNMVDQPDTGLVWTEECGSHMDEKVHAWWPMDDVGIAQLPEGVELKDAG